jgi:hypothetical protein
VRAQRLYQLPKSSVKRVMTFYQSGRLVGSQGVVPVVSVCSRGVPNGRALSMPSYPNGESRSICKSIKRQESCPTRPNEVWPPCQAQVCRLPNRGTRWMKTNNLVGSDVYIDHLKESLNLSSDLWVCQAICVLPIRLSSHYTDILIACYMGHL